MDLHENTDCKCKDTAGVAIRLTLIRDALQQRYATPEKTPEHHRRNRNLSYQYFVLPIQPLRFGIRHSLQESELFATLLGDRHEMHLGELLAVVGWAGIELGIP